YANLPEESVYFNQRLGGFDGRYTWMFYGNLLINFAFPFLALMTRDAKRQMIMLKIVCIAILIGHWSDFYLMLMPGTMRGENGFLIEIAIVMASLIFAGWKAWTRITGPAPKDSVVVELMGKQFNWLVRYPGRDMKLGVVNYRLIDASNDFGFDLSDKAALDDFTSTEIHVPKGHPVLIKIRSRDVLHAVYMPHFRVQMYAVPGMPTRFWFTPTMTTDEMRAHLGNPKFNYELACNQICGKSHFAMKATLIVDEPDDYQAWNVLGYSWWYAV
nr:hypothetical protein [Tanacetum cinerariifolium]